MTYARPHCARRHNSIKSGKSNSNYKNDSKTLEAKQQRSVILAELRAVEANLLEKSLIAEPRTAARKPTEGRVENSCQQISKSQAFVQT